MKAMLSFLLLIISLSFTSCVTAKEPSISQNVQIAFFNAYSSHYSHGMDVNFSLIYNRPLASPFGLYSDIRCREPKGPYELSLIKEITIPQNSIPDQSMKVAVSWEHSPTIDESKQYQCQFRVFSVQTRILKPGDQEKAYEIISDICIKSSEDGYVQGSPVLNFIQVERKLCD